MPVRAAFASGVEFSAAVHARSCLLCRWRRDYGRSVRDRERCPYNRGLEKRSVHVKRAKKAKDRHGIQRTSKKRHSQKKAKLSGCSIIAAVTGKRPPLDIVGHQEDDEERNDAEPDDGIEWDDVGGDRVGRRRRTR